MPQHHPQEVADGDIAADPALSVDALGAGPDGLLGEERDGAAADAPPLLAAQADLGGADLAPVGAFGEQLAARLQPDGLDGVGDDLHVLRQRAAAVRLTDQVVRRGPGSGGGSGARE